MFQRILIVGALLAAYPAYSQQIDSHSITVSASRTANLSADEAVFAVFVDTGLDATLANVIAALQGAGITAANFAGLANAQPQSFNQNQPQPTLEWAFGLPVPLAKTKDTITALTNLQQSVMQLNNGYTLSFQAQGTRVSPQTLQSQPCVVADLIADARAQAQKLADAAGLTLGAVSAVSSYTSSSQGNNLLAGLYISRYSSGGSGIAGAICSATVKFSVARPQ